MVVYAHKLKLISNIYWVILINFRSVMKSLSDHVSKLQREYKTGQLIKSDLTRFPKAGLYVDLARMMWQAGEVNWAQDVLYQAYLSAKELAHDRLLELRWAPYAMAEMGSCVQGHLVEAIHTVFEEARRSGPPAVLESVGTLAKPFADLGILRDVWAGIEGVVAGFA